MALLINKLFSNRKKALAKHQDASEKLFNFNSEQLRLVLFRECDFRGRKLLFDSQSVQKIAVAPNYNKNHMNGSTPANKNENFVEISNGFGYQYSRPSSDIMQLGEMVFGSVAMSYRGTSLKIHSFSSPAKLMCTQVFPSPRHTTRARVSVTSQNFDALRSTSSLQSFEKSAKFDCSSTSSTTSVNDHPSTNSTESDLKITIGSGSVPLDVPSSTVANLKLPPSLEGDSGFCGEQSYSSVSSGPPSMSLWDTQQELASIHGFSCGSLYKRWFRSASMSLDCSMSESSLCGVSHNQNHNQTSASADECLTRSQQNHRNSKLGLAIIIQLSEGQEIDLEKFLLEHSALIESMVFRARSSAEVAYLKPGSFASLMHDIHKEISTWLTDLINGPTVNVYYWHKLGSSYINKINKYEICDRCTEKCIGKHEKHNLDSVKTNLNLNKSVIRTDNLMISESTLKIPVGFCKNVTFDAMVKTKSESSLVKNVSTNTSFKISDRTMYSNSLFSASSLEINAEPNRSFKLSRHFTNGWKNDEKSGSSSNKLIVNDYAENFVRELCELLENVDSKHTNFFISTLLTAVLTNHLGWVATVLPPSETDKETISRLRSPCNPLWGQLSDLYGAIGSPTKLSHTIICGSNKGDIITKILNVLTYFIRCSAIDKNYLYRYSFSEENLEADNICHENDANISEINKYNYKNQDKLNEMQQNCDTKVEELEMSTLNSPENNKHCGLSRTKTFRGDLLKENNNITAKPKTDSLLEKVTSLGFSVEKSSVANLTGSISTNFNKLNTEMDNLVDLEEASTQIRKIFQPKIGKLSKNTSCSNFLVTNSEENNEETKIDYKESVKRDNSVVFVLGDNEQLVGLRKDNQILNIPNSSKDRVTKLIIPLKKNEFSCKKKLFTHNSSSEDSSPDEICNKPNLNKFVDVAMATENNSCDSSRSIVDFKNNLTSPNKVVLTKSIVIDAENECDEKITEYRRCEEFCRSQSVPPSDKNQRRRFCNKNGCRKRKNHTGLMRLDLKQYPEIVTNYMKCKNIEMSQLKLNRSFSMSTYDCSKFDFSNSICDCGSSSEEETLQTPSNASELDFASVDNKFDDSAHRTREKFDRRLKFKPNEQRKINSSVVESKKNVFKAQKSDFDHPLQVEKENNAIFQHENILDSYEEKKIMGPNQMVLIELPMPRIISLNPTSCNANTSKLGYTESLLRSVSTRYISDMVLQGTVSPIRCWEHLLRRDLALSSRRPLLDQPVQEAIAIIANTDTWEVQLVSSHMSYVIDKSSTCGVPVGMSQLVANMLESLLHMWKLRTPPEYCVMHIESRLREVCIRSKALAKLLMVTEFCNMDHLITSLQLEVNDIPLLMAVASTHTPQLAHKYGLSFQ